MHQANDIQELPRAPMLHAITLQAMQWEIDYLGLLASELESAGHYGQADACRRLMYLLKSPIELAGKVIDSEEK